MEYIPFINNIIKHSLIIISVDFVVGVSCVKIATYTSTCGSLWLSYKTVLWITLRQWHKKMFSNRGAIKLLRAKHTEIF